MVPRWERSGGRRPTRRDQAWDRACLRDPYPIKPSAPRVAIARVEGSGMESATARHPQRQTKAWKPNESQTSSHEHKPFRAGPSPRSWPPAAEIRLDQEPREACTRADRQ